MKARLLAVSLLAIMLAFLCPSAHAQTQRVFDAEGLLTAAQQADLEAKLDDISARHDFDLVVATVTSMNGKEQRVFAADYYEAKGFGADGAILAVSATTRDWGFAATGFGLTAFTDSGQEVLYDSFLSDLSDDRFYDAFVAFADACDKFLTAAEDGDPITGDSSTSGGGYNPGGYETDSPYTGYQPSYPGYQPNYPYGGGDSMSDDEKATITAGGYTVGGGVAAVVAAAVPLSWRRKLRSVRPNTTAREYVRSGSMRLDVQADDFIRRSVIATPIPKMDDDNRHHDSFMGGSSFGGGGFGGGSFSSSSGGSFTGGGGKF
ncbi:MAG: TPM domain-containing protein [Propionibacteriaceae bacterium]|jgi:uncharacterized membrane protein YgcG|nr:TPM domain-containing protein [Propionibacteriaceae bacterium]